MGKFLDKFLEFKNEADATRKFALLAVVVITLGLASLSVTGIIATATWTFMSFLPIVGLIIAVLGAEALATVADGSNQAAEGRWLGYLHRLGGDRGPQCRERGEGRLA